MPEIFRAEEANIELLRSWPAFTAVDHFHIARADHSAPQIPFGPITELHAREIFIEERLRGFSHGPESDPGRRPDFLFPRRPPSTASRIFHPRICECWRVKRPARSLAPGSQREADRIPVKHLHASRKAYRKASSAKMTDAGVRLVVLLPLVSAENRAAATCSFGDLSATCGCCRRRSLTTPFSFQRFIIAGRR